MSEHESHFSVWGFIKGFAKLIIGVLLMLQGLIGLVVLILIVGVMVEVTNGIAGNGEKVSVSIPDEAALVLDPNGVLVEIAEDVNPLEVLREEAYGINEPTQIEVHDLVRVLRAAKDDKRIKGLVLDLGSMGASPSSASSTSPSARTSASASTSPPTPRRSRGRAASATPKTPRRRSPTCRSRSTRSSAAAPQAPAARRRGGTAESEHG